MYAFPSNDTHVGLDFSIHIILHYIFFIPFQLCDISLRAGVTTLSAHRVVLAAASPYFHAMFNGKLFNTKNQAPIPTLLLAISIINFFLCSMYLI